MTYSWQAYLFVALGGSLGAVLRFYLSNLSDSLFGKHFPFGTLAVNVIGAFFIAVVYGLIERESLDPMPYRFLVGVGLLGAFTTFSTFSIETLALLQNGLWMKAAMNVALNVFVCLFAAYIGMQLFKG
ncbi:fluoride efflux transporter CrcB [Alteromonas sediminis]|uniref:Fluoride-specific ion channel FluC n=1 Tax=Alteromonas sediminis TaxID=2259342 RepID=A0A3N5Y290_9ALTE|nr:fluoride efflux transporter CrcB [Alteromonas sediminis]RPJ67440.1 fluoride efflux transporter CrcB [Alteromonas sediminis]